jgi:hypothetical protein
MAHVAERIGVCAAHGTSGLCPADQSGTMPAMSERMAVRGTITRKCAASQRRLLVVAFSTMMAVRPRIEVGQAFTTFKPARILGGFR